MDLSYEPQITVVQSDIDKRTSRYTRLLVGQIVFIIFTLLLFQLYLQFQSKQNFLVFTFSFAIVGMANTWLMYSMVRNFSTSKTIIRFTFITFFISFWTGIFATNPLNPLPFNSPLYLTLATINQVGSFLSFVGILVLMIRDIFTESHSIGYRLLGAACIYFNIGIVFTFAYGTINLLVPNAMGLNMPAEFISYMHCVNYSFFILSGIDSPYDVNGIIHSVAVIESLFANLYIVLLIGRLLIK